MKGIVEGRDHFVAPVDGERILDQVVCTDAHEVDMFQKPFD